MGSNSPYYICSIFKENKSDATTGKNSKKMGHKVDDFHFLVLLSSHRTEYANV